MFEIVGIKKTSFNGKDGNKVEGVTLHCINHGYLLDSGAAVEKIFLPASRGYTVGDFSVGDMLEVIYNRFGKPQTVNVVQK